MKRFTSLILVFTLAIGTFPFQTLAQEETRVDTNEGQEAVTLDSSSEDGSRAEGGGSGDEVKDEVGDEVKGEGQQRAIQDLTTPLPEPFLEEPPIIINPPAYEAPQFNTDPKSFLSSFQGKADVSLFTGDLGYSFPLFVPKGRGSMTPNLSLNYSSNDSRFGGMAGYGWNLPTNAIYRVAREGYDKIYDNEDYFGIDLFGSSQQLMVVNKAKGQYRAKDMGEGMNYQFNKEVNQWVVQDTQGTTYTFGQAEDARQMDPQDKTKVFKWMLEKVEDVNGNFMGFTYVHDQNAVYPATIRYTGFGNEPGIFEVKFILEDRSATYSDYKTGFRVAYSKQIHEIELWSYANQEPELKMIYDLTYQPVNAAVSLLKGIQVKAGEDSLPPTTFEYFDGTEKEELKKLYALKVLHLPYGGESRFTYQPATAYREPNQTSSNWLPFVTHTLRSKTERVDANDPGNTTTYDYRRGHYYFDHLDAYKREYAGFGKVTVTDPGNNKQVLYFHQSEKDPNNKADAVLGEFEDHISKKGRTYRQETYDSQGKMMQESLTQWDKKLMPQGDSPEPRYQVAQARSVVIEHGENEAEEKAKASVSTVDLYGNPLQEIDYGEVQLLNDTGEFTDVGQDKLRTEYTYVQNQVKNLFIFPQKVERFEQANLKIGEMKVAYDGLPSGQIEKGNWTKQERLKDLQNNYAIFTQTYTPEGLPQTFTNPRGYSTQIAYEASQLYPQTVTNAKEHSTSYIYDLFFGQPTKMTDPNGHDSQNILDKFGRIDSTLIEDPQNQLKLAQKYDYNLQAKPVTLTKTDYLQFKDTGGQDIQLTERTFFDGLSRPIQRKQEAEEGNFTVTSQVYDERGQVKESYSPKFTQSPDFEAVNPNDPKSSITYDGLGRPKTESNSLGSSSTNYGVWSQLTTDANGHKKESFADSQGNLREVKEYNGNEVYSTKYTYDSNQNLTKIVDAEGNVTDFTYNLLGQRLTQNLLHKPNDNSPATLVFTYDPNGNLLTRKDAKGQISTYTYDEIDRPLTDKTASETITYTYDEPKGIFPIGRLTSVVGLNFQKNYKYDLMGRMTEEFKRLKAGGSSYVSQFVYAGLTQNVSQLTYPDGLKVNYRYNNAGQMEVIPGYVTALDYTPIGSISKLAYANGATTLSTYDPQKLWRMTSRVTTAGGTKLQNIAYTYDPVGNIKTILDTSSGSTAKKATYSYDALDRLLSAAITQTANNQNYSQTYKYSPTGNMLTKSDVGAYTYNAKHPQAVTQAGPKTYGYDLNGSLINSGLSTFTYDDRGRLSSSSVNTKQASYFYDESGERTYKSFGAGQANTYVNQYYEEELSGLVKNKSRFIYAGPIKVATVNPDNSVAFHHADHLSGANITTNKAGTVIETVDYYPYGEVRIEEKTAKYKNDYLFTGQERDEETGLMYYGARYYDAKAGRFMGVDPWEGDIKNPQTLNKYNYANSNPLKYSDPTGMKSALVIGADDFGSGTTDVDSFQKKAQQRAQELNDTSGGDFTDGIHYVDGSTFKNIQDALTKNKDISLIEFYGHGDKEAIYLRQVENKYEAIFREGFIKSIDQIDFYKDGGRDHIVNELNTANVLKDAQINLYSCHARNGGINSLAQSFANHFNSNVRAAANYTNFTGRGAGTIAYVAAWRLAWAKQMGFDSDFRNIAPVRFEAP